MQLLCTYGWKSTSHQNESPLPRLFVVVAHHAEHVESDEGHDQHVELLVRHNAENYCLVGFERFAISLCNVSQQMVLLVVSRKVWEVPSVASS